ncbi:bifunctional helix-turn-helix transcriptional regulator/GNAT family N-acetyltransferase [Plantactinospora sonchi]|uniref:Helix-turn-helix domain-containing GNAT family N-acetyltransferase n=1 Tax=Plantactinospora sonchi TaxID=1544735 RepID=A0ABU7RR05_9ACTN
MSTPAVSQVSAVRDFNRFYTRVIGVLDEGLLHTSYSLTEARVIFELARRGPTEVPDLRRDLALDPGYLSRILARFTADDLVTRVPSVTDSRRQVVELTDAGEAAYHMLNERSEAQVSAMLSELSDEDGRQLVEAMRTIRTVLSPTPPPRAYLLRELRPGDAGWVVHRHGARYAAEYGYDLHFEAYVARIVADYLGGHDIRRENAWIAEIDGQPVGSVFCVRRDDDVAQLRLLLVEPSARGLGIGSRLVDECLRFARQAGYREITLGTNDLLTAARRIYQKAGFELREQSRHDNYGFEVVEEVWSRPL